MTSEKVTKGAKPYDLEERTYGYTKDVFSLLNTCPKTNVNTEIIKQLIRSASSVGANYIEAKEALSKKDFGLRIKICRKEAKESAYWLRLLEISNPDSEKNRKLLLSETDELLRIFAKIVEKVKENKVK